ncbi:hypothetical protein DPMN_002177 [Dreissena polymorpha]|uniref:Uncharacterized protein n=1 Tax=Dreissena polymorpha TaxID=45954 RepID=A0A9D4MMB6_DREPO|nr:hypothetical protein DPMN_002177 [Dreissena polymorpha]
MYFTHVSRGYPRALLDDFTAAKAAFPGKPLIKCILEALLLSRKGLMDPVQFMPQLLGRLEDNEEIKIWNIKAMGPGAPAPQLASVSTGRVPLGHQDALFVTGSAREDSPNKVGVYDVGRLEYRAIRELVRRRFRASFRPAVRREIHAVRLLHVVEQIIPQRGSNLCDREAVKMVMANVYRLEDDRIMTTGKGDNYDFRVYDVNV